MPLTPAQLTTLKADISANTATVNGVQIKLIINNSDGNSDIAGWYNGLASPSHTVWKTNVAINDVGKKFNGSELAGMTTGNQTRLQTIALYLANGVNPSLADNRVFFDDVFSGAGGTNTRAALLILWKRLANRVEKLLATGMGSDAVPATLGFEGSVSYQDVEQARNS